MINEQTLFLVLSCFHSRVFALIGHFELVGIFFGGLEFPSENLAMGMSSQRDAEVHHLGQQRSVCLQLILKHSMTLHRAVDHYLGSDQIRFTSQAQRFLL